MEPTLCPSVIYRSLSTVFLCENFFFSNEFGSTCNNAPADWTCFNALCHKLAGWRQWESHQNLHSSQPAFRRVPNWGSDPTFFSLSSHRVSALTFLRFLFLVIPPILHLLPILTFIFLLLCFITASCSSISFSCFYFFLLLTSDLHFPSPSPIFAFSSSISVSRVKYVRIIPFRTASLFRRGILGRRVRGIYCYTDYLYSLHEFSLVAWRLIAVIPVYFTHLVRLIFVSSNYCLPLL
jgi:hypothetical protein